MQIEAAAVKCHDTTRVGFTHLAYGNIFLFHLHQHQVGCTDASTKERGVYLVEKNTAVLEHLPSHSRLENPVVGQRCVGPSDETIVAIPGALAVAQKAKIVGRLFVETGKRTNLPRIPKDAVMILSSRFVVIHRRSSSCRQHRRRQSGRKIPCHYSMAWISNYRLCQTDGRCRSHFDAFVKRSLSRNGR